MVSPGGACPLPPLSSSDATVSQWANEWMSFVDELERALCSRVVAAKGEVVEKGHTVEQAQYGRDALAKV